MSLRGAGYEVDTATTGAQALTAAAVNPPDAVILDLVLPDMRGTDVCRELRTWTSVPVIVLSVVADEEEKVAALDAGADDYVTKPFGVDELLARLRASLRRVDGESELNREVGELRVDIAGREVAFAGRPVQLTAARVHLPEPAHPERGQAAHPQNDPPGGLGATRMRPSPTTCTCTSRSSSRKLELSEPARPRYILTEPGVGYRLVDPSRRTS